ncbi:MAG: hypothetical protein PHI16_01945, partial [Methanocellales archaeon]|nr:hypothetical protein [Methanocellales archaeon]
VPDEIMSKQRKSELKEQWVVGPARTQNEDDKRKALARYYGGWEPGSGLVLSRFSPVHHVVPAGIVNWNHEVFKNVTLFRGLDHGLGRPGTCVWGMMFPWGQMLIYREYYQKDGNIPEHVQNITKLSGSSIVESDEYADVGSKLTFKTFKEQFGKEEYASTVLDSRSFASPGQESQRTIGHLYQDYGLDCSPARGWKNEKAVPHMELWFKLNPPMEHLMYHLAKRQAISLDLYEKWLKDRGGIYKNAPKIYFVSDLKWTFKEFRSWAKHPETGLPLPHNDHIAGGALKYLLIDEPRYEGHNRDDTGIVVSLGDPLEPRKKKPAGSKFVS